MRKVTGWVVVLLLAAGCADYGWIDLTHQPGLENNDNKKDTGEARLRRAQNQQDWQDFFVEQVVAQIKRIEQPDCAGVLDWRGGGVIMEEPLALDESGGEDADSEADVLSSPTPSPTDNYAGGEAQEANGDGAADDSAGSDAEGGTEYTGTNLQEFGVDESDVVKTDGEYFYLMVGNELRIIKAYPIEEMAEVASIELDGSHWSGGDLFLNGDRLIAITEPVIEYYYYDYYETGEAVGSVGVDVDTDELDVMDSEETTGDDADSADGRATAQDSDEIEDVKEENEAIDNDAISIAPGLPMPYINNGKTVVTLIDISDRANPQIEAEWTFDGYYNTSRMVDGVLHLIVLQYPYIPYDFDFTTLTAEQIAQYIPQYEFDATGGETLSGDLVAFSDFYMPVDPDGFDITTVLSLDTNEVTSSFSSAAILAGSGTVYASTEALYLTDASYDWFCDYRETLDIHKFAFTETGAQYVASGSVEGRLLNQFSLGEYDGYLRVATTTGWSWDWDGDTSTNNVFVLDENSGTLEVVGSISDIAPGEQIQSARFIGDRGFLVTFEQIDPLFTLDLADPADPQIAGELKVPGFSEYIHLMDEDHLLTLGRAATEEGWTQGLQLSIFDISNFAEPTLLDSLEIGSNGTNSEAEYNHKAFTYYAAEGLLAIPVDLYEAADEDEDWWWGEYTFSGLQVYDISVDDGISLKGQVATSELGEWGYPIYWGWTRGFFIEDLVYAVTEMGVHAANIADPSTVLSGIEIEGSPYVEEIYIDDEEIMEDDGDMDDDAVNPSEPEDDPDGDETEVDE